METRVRRNVAKKNRYGISAYLIFVWLVLLQPVVLAPPLLAEGPVDFSTDVQPLLRKHCFRCHGSQNSEGGFRLDIRAGALGEGDSGESLVTPGTPDESLLLHRLTDESQGDLMPLDSTPLEAAEIETIRAWIAQGATWPDELAEGSHWAYEPLQRPPLPSTNPAVDDEAITPIDRYVQSKLKRLGLEMSSPADRSTLLRRASLALVGLPPTPEELSEYLNDRSPEAYERALDRLLDSHRFGERWAVPWLDLARYADSNGFQADQIRDNWAYRDWVIRSMNADMPFDQFVIEQLAGDLLPDATVEQHIATGFHRMTTCNVEAGVHPEANRVNQIVDRVNTTATVFMGTTMECAQCHDHKYDPFTQQDYYQLFAYFNNTPLEVENTSGVTWDFYGPKMELPLPPQKEEQRHKLLASKKEILQSKEQLLSASDDEYQAWLQALKSGYDPKQVWTDAAPSHFETSGEETYEILADGAVLLGGKVPDQADYTFTFQNLSGKLTALRIDALTDEAIPGKGPGRGDAKRTNIILSEVRVELVQDENRQRLQLRMPAADFSQNKWDVSGAIDGDKKTGWAISPQFGKPHWCSFVFSKPVELESGSQLRIQLGQYYGQGRVMAKPKISFSTIAPQFLSVDEDTVKLARKEKRSEAQETKLRNQFERTNLKLQELDDQLESVEKKLSALAPDTTLVMVENREPRDTFVMLRGDYESPGQKVEPGVPAAFKLGAEIERTGDRLELARWLTSMENPLLARVTVNRWWAEIFGSGLVNTPEDFGSQAEFPSHPQLLNWLACELVESGWSRKHVLKTILMSQTFQQTAAAPDEAFAQDPDNRLLGRGPRFRMPAEMLRDNALAISGLLSDAMYGPPIMPYQPENIWRSVGRNQPTWVAAKDQNRFRRGVYIVYKRAAPYPSMINFDAPDRGACTVYRARTNTPLQALTLLNDSAYAEMALAFADRVLCQPEIASDEARINFAFQLALARQATSFESSVLQKLLRQERRSLTPANIDSRTQAPIKMLSPRYEDRAELAAWFAITNAILNLDETMNR